MQSSNIGGGASGKYESNVLSRVLLCSLGRAQGSEFAHGRICIKNLQTHEFEDEMSNTGPTRRSSRPTLLETTGLVLLVLTAALSVLAQQQEVPQGSLQKPQADRVNLFIELGSNHLSGGIDFSPHGEWILTNYSGTADLWETATGREIRAFNSPHHGVGNDAAYSPTGKRIALITNNTVLLVDPRSGEIVCEIHAEQDDSYDSITFSPDGELLLTGSENSVDVWKVATCKKHGHWLIGADAFHTSVAFSRKGDLFAVGTWNGKVYVWDFPRGELLAQFRGDDEYVNTVAFSADGERLLVGGTKSQAALWNWRRGRVTQRYLGHTDEGVTMARFSPLGDRVITTGNDNTAILYETETGKILHTFGTEADHTDRNVMNRAIFSNDGRFILTDSFDRSAVLWDAKTFALVRGLESHIDEVNSVASSHDGAKLAAGLDGSGIAVWDLGVGNESFRLSPTEYVKTVAFSPDSKRLASGSPTSTIFLWDIGGGTAPIALKTTTNTTPSLAFSTDGKKLAAERAIHQSEATLVWDIPSRRLMRTIRHKDFVQAVAYSPTGPFIASGEWHRQLTVENIETGKAVASFHYSSGSDMMNPIQAIAFSPNGNTVAVSGSSEILLWNWKRDTKRLLKLPEGEVTSLTFSDSGRQILYGNSSGDVALVSLDSGAILSGLKAPGSRATSVCLLAKTGFAVAGYDDGTMKLWRLADGQLMAVMVSFRGEGWAVVAPDGRFDASDLDVGAPLHWTSVTDPMRPLPLEIFMRDYYTPGLLARILKGEKLPDLPSIADIKNRVQPDVKVMSVTVSPATPARVDVVVHAASHADENGVRSGLQDLRLFRDGQLVANGYREGPLKDGDFVFHDVMLKSGSKKATFTAYAFNSERIKSATASLDYTPQVPVPSASAKPRAYLLQIGVNHFGASNCELSYSVNDAEKMNADLSERLKAEGFDIQAVKLESPEGGNVLAAGKQAIHDQLSAIASQATPDDVFFMSFSGHGYSAPGGVFYILPSDIQGSCHQVDDTLLKSAISADELGDWLRPIDAGEMTLILDACFSAEGVEAGDFKPGPLGSQGLGQVAYDKRMRVLAASQSDEVAHEYGYLQQGLLTYVLTHEGLDQGKADWKPVDKKIMVGEWLGYAANAVPKFNPASAGQNDSKAAGDRFNNSTPNSVLQIPALFDFSKTDSLQLQ